MTKAIRARIPANLEPIFSEPCTACKLSENSFPVKPRGNWESKTLFVAEAAGAQEEKRNVTVCGPAGEELDKTCNVVGIDINRDVLVWNAVLCRPHSTSQNKENRPPEKDELIACRENLKSVINSFNPELIVAVGKVALQQLIPSCREGITQVAGQFFTPDDSDLDIEADIYPIYHPSYICRRSSVKPNWVHQLLRLRDYMIMRKLF